MMFTPLLLALSLHAPAFAKSLAGVTLPDTATVGGQTLALNGLGLREKFYIDVYVGGLYLQHPTHDGGTAAAANEPKRIVMHFVYKVSKEQMSDSFKEGFAASPGATADQIQQVFAAMPETISPGQEVVIDYVPGVGTSFVIAGNRGPTLTGEAFMKALFGIYLGGKPPTADLKRGLLGV
jgi:hypothetical protein